MHLIAFRPEYQITVNPAKNRVFYKPFAEMNQAAALPHYLADWQLALAQVQSGFTILTDVTQMGAANPHLLDTFVAAQSLLVAGGVRLVAEIHLPDSVHQATSEAASRRSALPVRRFLDLWEGDQYLDGV